MAGKGEQKRTCGGTGSFIFHDETIINARACEIHKKAKGNIKNRPFFKLYFLWVFTKRFLLYDDIGGDEP